uniref:RRM domain-containing protein n=1 Tax=Haptolina brevifila TaxID=156173 RepID=A0A7S2B7L2_9EUKA|mmetsp:Transcript_10307/g.21029  ORF Transcript_10307/g.21029 Transcript_10307/m.21029 type:complete len:125 (+) Transcript_10307:43-417(+)
MTPNTKWARLFIGGLSSKTTEESLRRYFETWGKVDDATVRSAPGRGNLHAFITVLDPREAETILASTHTIDGSIVTVELAKWPSATARQSMQICKMFVGGLPPQATEQTLNVSPVPCAAPLSPP